MRVTRAVVLCLMVALPAMPAWAQGQASDVVKADEAVTKALAAGDRAGASKLLDADFSWVDPDGIYYATRDEAFRAGVRPLVGVGADVKVLEHRYGKLVYLERSEGDKKFSGHFWAQRAINTYGGRSPSKADRLAGMNRARQAAPNRPE